MQRPLIGTGGLATAVHPTCGTVGTAATARRPLLALACHQPLITNHCIRYGALLTASEPLGHSSITAIKRGAGFKPGELRRSAYSLGIIAGQFARGEQRNRVAGHWKPFSGPVAQVVEHCPFKARVPGSSPGRLTSSNDVIRSLFRSPGSNPGDPGSFVARLRIRALTRSSRVTLSVLRGMDSSVCS